MNHVQQQNVQLLRMIAKIDKEGGKVSTRWDKFFTADWYEHLRSCLSEQSVQYAP